MPQSTNSQSKTRVECPPEVIQAFKEIVGPKNVLTDELDCHLYSYDSAIDRAEPRAVVFPETTEQVSKIVKICVQNKICFVARGAGTNLCGGTIPLNDAVVIAPTKMKKILSIDPEKRIAVVEPGLPNLFLKKALEPYGLFYAPDPASQKACTIGGNIGTNAGGPHCLKYGVTSHNVLGLEVVLPDGEIAELNLNQSGYDLTGLMVGAEGTLGIVTKATLELTPIPKRVETMLVSFPSIEASIQTVTDIVAAGILPSSLEAMDKVTVRAVEEFVSAGYPTDAEAVLLIEVDGGDEVLDQVKAIEQVCKKNNSKEFRLAKNNLEREKLWEGRRGAYPAMAKLAPNVLVEDGAVPRNKLPEALKKIRGIADGNRLKVALVFHAGDGNLHPQILFDERDPTQTYKVKTAGYKMLKTCVELGGSISGEHGVGMDKRDAMKWLFSPETLETFRNVKKAFDPENLCNPDKLIPLANSKANKGKSLSPLTLDRKSYEPRTQEELSQILSSADLNSEKISIHSKKTKGSDSQHILIAMNHLNQVLDHDRDNFTVEAQAGLELRRLEAILKEKNQKVLLVGEGTLGSLLANNPLQTPRLRDLILGMKVILSNGSLVVFGGKVMKNVAGYDLAKLFLGSRGTLGVIYSVTLKTYPLSYSVVPKSVDSTTLNQIKTHSAQKLSSKIKNALDPKGTFASIESV